MPQNAVLTLEKPLVLYGNENTYRQRTRGEHERETFTRRETSRIPLLSRDRSGSGETPQSAGLGRGAHCNGGSRHKPRRAVQPRQRVVRPSGNKERVSGLHTLQRRRERCRMDERTRLGGMDFKRTDAGRQTCRLPLRRSGEMSAKKHARPHRHDRRRP